MSKWNDGPKVSLDPEEVLRIAAAHLLMGVHQHTLASMWGTDSGRVAEAVIALRWAAEHHKLIYRHVNKGKKRNGKSEEKPSLSQPLFPGPMPKHIEWKAE